MAALFLALMMAGLPVVATAQTPPNFRIPPVALDDPDKPLGPEDELPELELPEVQISTLRNVIVDTDPGVDDAAALVWLLSQDRYPVNPLGIVTVAGNTTVENATTNVLLLLDWLGLPSIPVVQGAAAPISRVLSTVGAPLHGPDGLWFLSSQYDVPDIPVTSTDAVAFYCETLSPNSNTLIIALGPLTNLAQSFESCPEQWIGAEIVSLGGAKYGGNQTPVTEYNYWQDPAAANTILANAGPDSYWVQMVPFDAFQQFAVRPQELQRLRQQGVVAIQNLLPAIDSYAQAVAFNGAPLTLPDVAAAVYALNNAFGDSQSALVKVLSDTAVPDYARGQTVVGLVENEKLTLIASDQQLSDLANLAIALLFGQITPEEFGAAYAAILYSEPDNAAFVTNINQVLMYLVFLKDLTARPDTGVGAQIEGSGTAADDEGYRLFVPMLE